jgi:molybdenum cofactor sulfurtransferase
MSAASTTTCSPTSAQSNFSGVQHPLVWIEQAHELGWDVLLDAAAFVPTNRLDLAQVKPNYPVVFRRAAALRVCTGSGVSRAPAPCGGDGAGARRRGFEP